MSPDSAPAGMVEACGARRRLQALAALAWPTTELQRALGWTADRIEAVMAGARWVSADGHAQVVALYDRLSMTIGPCPQTRDRATAGGWAPPLAWDDELLDNPTGKPVRCTGKALRWDQRYREWRDLGYDDLEIIRRFGVRPDTLATMLYRYGLPVSAALTHLANREKRRRREMAAAS